MKRKDLILVIEDDMEFARSLQDDLQLLECEVMIASEKEKARQIVLAHKPSLILLGTILPRGEAYRLHKWFKQTPGLKEVPHVVLDASPENHLNRGWRRDEGMRVEAVEYFCKPIKTEVLANEIWKLIAVEATEIKVLIADDHAMVREGIRTLLNLQQDIYIVGEAINGVEAVDKALQLSPDVVLMDVVMPDRDGIEATKQIANQCKENVKVLMLSQYDDEQNLLASNQAGALGFVSKKSASSKLLEAVRAVSRGERPGNGQKCVS